MRTPRGVIKSALRLLWLRSKERSTVLKSSEYCWALVSHQDRSVSLDTYNIGLKFNDKLKPIIMEDEYVDQDCELVRRIDIV